MDVVNAIPELIERLVKCARLVQDAANIDKAVDYDIDHGRHMAHQLVLMAQIMKRSKYLPGTAAEVSSALCKAEQATIEVNCKLNELSARFGLSPDTQHTLPNDMPAPDASASTSSQDTLSEKPSLTTKAEQVSLGTAFRRRWSCIPVTGIKLKLKTFLLRSKARLPRKQAIFRLMNGVHYLALMQQDLKAALARMDRAHDDLFRLMFIAPMHLRVVGDEDAQEFIRNAQIRRDDPRPVEHLTIPREWLRPVDDRLKANKVLQERPYTLYTVKNGPYAGCLVDRRDIRHLWTNRKLDKALGDTDFLARVLRRDPTSKDGRTDEKIAVLRCRGVSFPNRDLHDLVFQLPPGLGAPRTLRRVLLDDSPDTHIKDARIKLALQLCTALHVLHSLNVVHKGVRPENIILLPPLDSSVVGDGNSPALTLGKPYLAGFCYSRSDNSDSGMAKPYNATFAELIYFHPRHIRTHRDYEFDKSDDIYSLGICLLEIGLWRSLLYWGEKDDWYITREEWGLRDARFYTEDGFNKDNAWYMRKDEFMKVAREALPVSMSSTYAEVVLSCLNFRETENARVGLEANVPLDFVEEVMSKLISMKY